MDGGRGVGDDDEAHDTDGQTDALEDPRAQVARSYGLVVGPQDREHQDTDADHECRVEQHQRGAGDEQLGRAAAVSGADDARRYEAAYAVCQEAGKEKDPNDPGGPTHAGVRANDWRGSAEGELHWLPLRVERCCRHAASDDPWLTL